MTSASVRPQIFFPTTTLKSLIDELGFPVGTVLPPKAPYDARAAALAAGIPDTVPLQIINRYVSIISGWVHIPKADRCDSTLSTDSAPLD